MPINSGDIQFRLSGGESNSNPDLSLGGEKSDFSITSATHNLFDRVGAAEAAQGSVEYRCIYVRNDHSSLTLHSALIYISENTENPNTVLSIGIGEADTLSTEQAVANESSAPIGVDFYSAENSNSALFIGNIPAGQHKAIWLRRTVIAGASASNDSATIIVSGETEE